MLTAQSNKIIFASGLLILLGFFTSCVSHKDYQRRVYREAAQNFPCYTGDIKVTFVSDSQYSGLYKADGCSQTAYYRCTSEFYTKPGEMVPDSHIVCADYTKSVLNTATPDSKQRG